MIKSTLLRSSPDRAFEALYRRHVRDVYRYCAALLHRQADAEDATQTTFMNAYRALERGERPRDPGNWLRAVALNVCREHVRRAGRRPDEVSLEDDPGDLVIEPSVPEIGDVMKGLSCLPFNQRAALVMREFEGRSLAEIAASLRVSASAVEALLFRARRALREQLEEQLTCGQAERAISKQLDGALARGERGQLRAHLRQCGECAALARRVRAQRSAIRSLALLPLPAALRWGRLAGGGAGPAPAAAATAALPSGGSAFAGLTASVAAKLAALVVAGGAIGVGYSTLSDHPARTAAGHGATVTAQRSSPRARAAPARSAALRAPATGGRATPRSPVRAHVRSTRGRSAGAAVANGKRQATITSRGRGSSSAAGSTHSRGSSNGAAHRAPAAPASHGAQKPFKGSGHAYGRSQPKKPHPVTSAPHASPPISTAPGRLTSQQNKGHTTK